MKTPEEIKKGLAVCMGYAESCAICPYYHDKECIRDIKTDALAYIQQLEAQVPRWIPVEERLPDKGVFVVVYYGHFIGDLMDVYMWDGECWRSSTGYLEDADNITHWMPLPQPPEEE